MALSVNWGTKVITVPKADLSLVDIGPPEIRELDLNDFRLWLKDIEDSEEGIVQPDTHTHNTEVVLGNLTLARVIEMINGYTITFEDGNYQVDLVGANSNVSDVTNLNSVGLRSYNSAGLILVGGENETLSKLDNMIVENSAGNYFTPAALQTIPIEDIVDAINNEVVEGALSHADALRLIIAVLMGKSSGGGTDTIRLRDIGDSKDRVVATVDDNGNRTGVVLDGS